MFTSSERDNVRNNILAFARTDARVLSAAVTGSAAGGTQDEWSDVDLAFGVAGRASVDEVLDDWTAMMYRDHAAVHHVDVLAGAWIYRVFLLRSSLQVDLAFAPASQFGARAPTFRLVFGDAVELPSPRTEVATDLLGMGWLYALHVRSSIERGRRWQAELMLGWMRGELLKLACLRHGLPTSEGRGADRLPKSVTERLERALPASLESAELRRAFEVAIEALVGEAQLLDGELAGRVEPILRQLAVR